MWGVGEFEDYTIVAAKVVQKFSTASFFYQEQSSVLGTSLNASLIKMSPSFGIPTPVKNPVVVGLEFEPIVAPEARKEKRGLSVGGSGKFELGLGRHSSTWDEVHGKKPHHLRPRSQHNLDNYSEEDLNAQRERQTRSIVMKKLKKQALSEEDSSSSSSSESEEFEPLHLYTDKAFLTPFSPYGVYFSGNTKDTKSLELFPWLVVEFRKIAEELQDPDRIPFRGTLARISNAIQVMRSTRPAELRQVADKLYYDAPQDPSEREEVFYTSW